MLHCLENELLRVEVNSLGAELWSVYDKRSDRQLLWQGDAAVWPRRSPILFPICGRLHGGALPLHGFIRDYEHSLAGNTADAITFSCPSTPDTVTAYPYPFSFYTEYRLEGATLHCSVRVVNGGENPLPFSVGFHSGFFADRGSVLMLEQGEHCAALGMDSDGFLSRRIEDPLHGENAIPLQSEFFPGTLLLEGPRSCHADLVTDGIPVLRLGFVGFPYLAVWTNKESVPFVCIEPWHGLPDGQVPSPSLEEKAGMVLLPPGEEFCCEQTITALGSGH